MSQDIVERLHWRAARWKATRRGYYGKAAAALDQEIAAEIEGLRERVARALALMDGAEKHPTTRGTILAYRKARAALAEGEHD